MSQYVASVPSGNLIRPEIQAFYERFYQVSDAPDDHARYADMFTKDAKVIMGSSEFNGRDEIINMRHGMWEKVAKRSHKPFQLYPFGQSSDDVMLFGTVGYELKDGRKTTIDWAAHSRFTDDGGELRMEFYQVYLDSAAVSRAK